MRFSSTTFATALAVLVISAAAALGHDVPAVHAAPAHDDFALATVVAPGALPFSEQIDTTEATDESGEPLAGCASFGKTVWYRFTPAQSGVYRASTTGSSFDTVLTAYTGSTLASLVPAGCNDDAAGTRQSSLLFDATAGVPYSIQLGGYGGGVNSEAGSALFSLSEISEPPNDDFADAMVIGAGALPFAESFDNTLATTEIGEPASPCGPIGRTTWYRFTPAQSGVYQARTTGSSFDTIVAVYTGAALASLAQTNCTDDSGGTSQSRTDFQAFAGETYSIQVGGYGVEPDVDYGAGVFALEEIVVPPNDDLADAIVVSPGALWYADSRRTEGATFETGEPQDCGPLSKTVWYSFTPALSGSYVVDTAGSNFDTVVGVKQGTSFATMLPWSCNDNITGSNQARAQFNATAGQTYSIQLGGKNGDSGSLEVLIEGEDSDGDGCSNIEEDSDFPVFGGDRHPGNAFDFFDVTDDAYIDLEDTLLILDHFGHGPNDDAVDDLLDRYAPDSNVPYRTAEAIEDNEGVDLADALLNLASFGHSCAGAP